MSRRFAFYLTQEGVDELAQELYRLQAASDILHRERPTPDRPYRILSELRRQCCERSGAADPFPDLPCVPSVFEGQPRKRRRRA